MFRCRVPQNTTNFIINRGIGGVILAIHLKIHPKGRPARTKIGFPLQLHIAASHRKGHLFTLFGVKGNGAILGVHRIHRYIKHPSCLRMNGQEDGVGFLPLLAKRDQHHLHDIIIFFHSPQQNLIKLTRLIELCGADEVIFKAKCVQKPTQHGIVVMTEALIFPKRIWNRGQGPLQMLGQPLRIRHIARHFAHAIEIIRKTDEPGWDVTQFLKCAHNHCGTRHFAKGANMRQPAGAIARLKQDIAFFRRLLFKAFQDPPRLFKGPSFRLSSSVTHFGHV